MKFKPSRLCSVKHIPIILRRRHYNNEGYNNDEILDKEKIVKNKLLIEKHFHMKKHIKNIKTRGKS